MEFSEGTMASAAKARSLHEAISPYEQAQQPSQVDIVSVKCHHLPPICQLENLSTFFHFLSQKFSPNFHPLDRLLLHLREEDGEVSN